MKGACCFDRHAVLPLSRLAEETGTLDVLEAVVCRRRVDK
jgi:hypothetical protein